MVGSIKTCRCIKIAPQYKDLVRAFAMFVRLLVTLPTIFIVHNVYFDRKDAQALTLPSIDGRGVPTVISEEHTEHSSSYVDGGKIVSANTYSSSIVEAETGHVIKSTFSDRMRLLFLVGLEGSGHHYLEAVVDAVFAEHEEFTNLERCNIAVSCDLRQYAKGNTKYVEDMKSARHGMREVAELEKMLPLEGALVTLQGCNETGMESFPNFSGHDKVLQYPDLRLLAEISEAEGVDLRFVYLKRSAKEILASTIRRGYYRQGKCLTLLLQMCILMSAKSRSHSNVYTWHTLSSTNQCHRPQRFCHCSSPGVIDLLTCMVDFSIRYIYYAQLEAVEVWLVLTPALLCTTQSFFGYRYTKFWSKACRVPPVSSRNRPSCFV